MKRLITLALSVILITGCNAMKPNMEETQLLSKEIEKRIYAQALPTEAPDPVEAAAESKETAPSPVPIIVRGQKAEALPALPEPAEEPRSAAPETAEESEEIPLQQADPAEIIEWPYITCPPEPTSTPVQEWPHITASEPPSYTAEHEPIEPPQEEPSLVSQPTPAVPADHIDPTPEPTLQPATPTHEPPTEQPSGGYAECSCGARLTPEEFVPHMKAHAMNGESHSYRAY